MSSTQFENVLRFFNEATSDDLVRRLQVPADLAAGILAQRTAAGGMLTSTEQLKSLTQITPQMLAQLSDAIQKLSSAVAVVEPERLNFVSLILENPNYFGNLEGSPFKPVKPLKGNTTYEQLVCVGLQPSLDRLEAVVNVRQTAGYGGDICSAGSYEYVRFFVDLHDNGIFTDVGLASVNVHNIPGSKPLCYSVFLDFTPIRKLCLFENVVKVRAILSWNAAPPSNPNFIPVWGNTVDAEIQVRPAPFIFLGDLAKQIELAKVQLPDPIGPIIKTIDPETKLAAAAPKPLSLAEKRRAYLRQDIPVHRFAFSELKPLVEATAAPAEVFASTKTSVLADLGLVASEIEGLIGKLKLKTDGDTSFEQLNCIGLRPSKDALEGVLTVKKKSGYSGQLCSHGSTEYVAFWADFNDGTGFNYLGTATVNVHDLASIPAGGVQYAVFRLANLSKWRVPCELGARIGRLRAILSWEAPPPPTNPNYIPVWGNRVDCLIQIRPGKSLSHVPLMETVGDVPVNRIDQSTGLATGALEIASAVNVLKSPFGGEVTITGEIGLPPDVLGGGQQPFKYKIEVKKDDGIDTYHPLLNPVPVSVVRWDNGVPVICSIFPLEVVCQETLIPTDDGDGLGDGWYTSLEDTTGLQTRHLVVSVLGRWQTTAAMEGVWKMRITAKNPNVSPPTVYAGTQELRVRIDNTAPVASLQIVSATFNGQPVPAVNCGKFKPGTIITGTYSAHDPGTGGSTAAFQHFGGLSLAVLPAAPAHNAAVDPSSRAFPIVPTIGEDGTWTLNTGAIPANPVTGDPGRPAMDPCGYVIYLSVYDRTNVNSTGQPYWASAQVGFCIEA